MTGPVLFTGLSSLLLTYLPQPVQDGTLQLEQLTGGGQHVVTGT